MSNLDKLPATIGAVIDRQIRPLFKSAPDMKVTVLIRFSGDDCGLCDVLVTDDDDAGIRAIVDRRLASPA